MKRLLANLFIVFGLGLTFSVNADAKGKHLCFIDWPSNIEYSKVWQGNTPPVNEVVFIKRLKYEDGSSCLLKIIESNNEKLYKRILWSAYDGHSPGNQVIVDGKKMVTRWMSYKKLNKILDETFSFDKSLKIYPKKLTVDSKIAKAEATVKPKNKNLSNKLPICMNPIAGAKSWYFIKEDGHCYKTLEVKLTNENSLYNTYYNNIYNKKVYEGKIKTTKKKNDSSLFDKLKKGSQEIINNISSDSKKKKIVKRNKPRLKSKTKQIKVIEKPKSQFEKKVLAALELEKNNKVKCLIVEKSNLFTEAKVNFCIKKSDVIKLGEYKKFEKFPKNMVATIKGCKSNTCIRKKAGQNVYKLFVQKKERYHTKNPGDIIYGMAWFEILYLDKLKKTETTIKRYTANQYTGLGKMRKKDDEKKIYSIIKMNNGRIKMRNALGLSLYDDLELVLKNHWLLGDFLNNDKLKVEKVALDPQLKKRKLLLEKYKSTLSKYKKKLEEKNNNS